MTRLPVASDARRRAEEALRRVLANAAAIVRLSWSDGATPSDRANLERIKSAAADIAQDHKILSALLAAGPEAKAPGHDRIGELESLLRECNAVCLCGCPDSEHESYDEDGESCGQDDHECIRVAPAVLEIVNRYRVALSAALAAQPPSDAVREAAERYRAARDSSPSGSTGFIAAIHWLEAFDALAAPAPAPAPEGEGEGR